ncbi:hypothetical protein LAV84_05025 [Rhizobium sp. VS19-DR104.2]|uniref:hypothetical protein n=1 Tax=unclassified Rhizobium TaxID=2613769 RepID=UPI001CC48A26|nr:MULTISPECIES: hypothetical protein [unclassified Rhizobium]MBZ5757954.1 hypothetical protein [Rhizobium sp. VS19-DR96]MBZ5765216.1 hypothetical protein [Rhizobium sp. VS19-DR129.2]MBZ5772759.1 hypothetical protein [Rhizobium sp. VS19-DRK62.2]MBZ5782554.1 hypothetical protein [Rhizobium sp. VS19-DR121]MBZ5800002.1 hypothetical protein [Rhizobium sp. VS19-DR181]
MSGVSQTDYRQLTTDTAVAAATAAAVEAAAAAMVPAKVAWTADITITYSGLLALSLVPRTKNFDIAGAKVEDRVYVHRRGVPTLAGIAVGGVMIEGTGYVISSGKVDVYHTIPAVGALQTLTIPLRLIGYRAAS